MTDTQQTESSPSPSPSPKAREPAHHGYDNPNLGPRGFLLAVMRDPHALLSQRMDAAVKLLELYPDLYAHDHAPTCTIIIPSLAVH